MNETEEKEIDLRELFKIIWNKKLFIVIFTSIITLLAILYMYSKTPIYEVSSVIKIASVNNVIIEDSELLAKKVKLIYNVEDKEVITKDNGIVSKVSITKNVPNFIEIATQALSNKTAIEKNNEVLKFIQDEYKYKIDEYKELVNRDIYNLNKQIEYIKNIDLINLKEKVKFLNEVANLAYLLF